MEFSLQMRAIPNGRGVVRVTLSVMAFVASVSGKAETASANHLIITNDNCAIQVCPHPIPTPSPTVRAGETFGIYVAARDASNARDISYGGTISFSSSDPTATLPSPYTFVPADEGGKAFAAVLRSAGQQSITVTDVTGNLTPGTLSLIVMGGPSPSEVPTLTAWVQLFLALLLGSLGVWLCKTA